MPHHKNTDRTNIASGAPWEPLIGYSRAVRIGAHVWVAGTTGTDESGRVVSDGPYAQAVHALDKIELALRSAGASSRDVVRTRIFVSNIEHWKEIARAHAERFGEIRPACTLVAVAGFVNPEMLVEIEVDAFVAE